MDDVFEKVVLKLGDGEGRPTVRPTCGSDAQTKAARACGAGPSSAASGNEGNGRADGAATVTRGRVWPV